MTITIIKLTGWPGHVKSLMEKNFQFTSVSRGKVSKRITENRKIFNLRLCLGERLIKELQKIDAMDKVSQNSLVRNNLHFREEKELYRIIIHYHLLKVFTAVLRHKISKITHYNNNFDFSVNVNFMKNWQFSFK